jgi:hypothetical protein
LLHFAEGVVDSPHRSEQRDDNHQPNDTMNNTAKYIRQNDNKEYTIVEVNEDLKQIILRDTNTGTTLKMAKQSFDNNFKLA